MNRNPFLISCCTKLLVSPRPQPERSENRGRSTIRSSMILAGKAQAIVQMSGRRCQQRLYGLAHAIKCLEKQATTMFSRQRPLQVRLHKHYTTVEETRLKIQYGSRRVRGLASPKRSNRNFVEALGPIRAIQEAELNSRLSDGERLFHTCQEFTRSEYG